MAKGTKHLDSILASINAAHEKDDMDEVARLAKEYARLATLDERLNELNAAHAKGDVADAASWAREVAATAEVAAKRDSES